MPEDREQLCQVSGAGVGGHASAVTFTKDEAGRLEVAVGSGEGAAVAVMAPEDVGAIIDVLSKKFVRKTEAHKASKASTQK